MVDYGNEALMVDLSEDQLWREQCPQHGYELLLKSVTLALLLRFLTARRTNG